MKEYIAWTFLDISYGKKTSQKIAKNFKVSIIYKFWNKLSSLYNMNIFVYNSYRRKKHHNK